MPDRQLLAAISCFAAFSLTVNADEWPKPDGMKLIYRHDFDDVRIYVPE